jgi:hypothetical protein
MGVGACCGGEAIHLRPAATTQRQWRQMLIAVSCRVSRLATMCTQVHGPAALDGPTQAEMASPKSRLAPRLENSSSSRTKYPSAAPSLEGGAAEHRANPRPVSAEAPERYRPHNHSQPLMQCHSRQVLQHGDQQQTDQDRIERQVGALSLYSAFPPRECVDGPILSMRHAHGTQE